MSDCISTRTEQALGDNLVNKLRQYKYCVVGCGGTGALFAEMLVRSGAKNIALVDGDTVGESNLNRVVSFVHDDVGNSKVDVLAARLKNINSDIAMKCANCHCRDDRSDTKGQLSRDLVYNADIVIIAVDKNKDRITCEKLCYEDSKKKVLSIGVYVHLDGCAGYECAWRPETPEDKTDKEGYGNGSYASIVIEATSVAFDMLLHNLANPNSKEFHHFYKSYKNFVPTCIEINHNQKFTLISSNSKPCKLPDD